MNTAVRAIGFVLLASTAATAADSRCANEIIERRESPDGRLAAVVFVRACGEPARFSTQIALLKSARSLPDVAGNVFQCTGSHGLGAPGGAARPVSAVWETNDVLLVRYPAETDVLSAKTKVKKVLVRYRAVDPEAE